MNQSARDYNIQTLQNTSPKLKHLAQDINDPFVVTEYKLHTDSPRHTRFKSPQNGILFIYNLKSDINCVSASKTVDISLGTFQSIMITKDQEIELALKNDQHYHFCVIRVEDIETLGDFNEDFFSINFKVQEDNAYWYTGIPNIKLSNYITDLINLKATCNGNQLMLCGYANLIIGLKLEEFNQFINGAHRQVDLRTDEIDRIHECIQYVKENYAKQIDIDMLCLKSALSPQKLQTGFRELYGNTVTSFIKNFRLEKAEELMRTTELNVSQIVYTIGLTSRSYFSKIFREKYELSPNDYLKKFKYQII